ncbi:hypothetical protein D3C80_737430 [compost metagenome]
MLTGSEPASSAKLQPEARVNSQAPANPSSTPSSAPATESNSASSTNSQAISQPRAPRAMRTPISRRRCTTFITMTFITPTPPSSSAMAAVLANIQVIIRDCPAMLSSICRGS